MTAAPEALPERVLVKAARPGRLRGIATDTWRRARSQPRRAGKELRTGVSQARASDGGELLLDEAGVGLVAFGRGVRSGVQLPELRQIDIAPTLAASLGILMRGAEGRPLIGALATEAPR